MSVPVEPDYVVVELGDGAATEAFAVICGIETAGVNQTVTSTDRFRRDCAKPAAVPTRKVRVTGKQWDMTGSGVINMDEFDRYNSALGVRRNYRILYGRFDTQADGDTERTGTIYGYYTGPGVMTAFNQNVGGDEGTAEITIAGEDGIVWTAGVPGAGGGGA